MLILLRAEDFRTRLKTAPVNLVELIQKVIDQVRPFLEARQHRLVTELDDDLGTFELDADKISAVLINLLTNAIKFTPDGGTIELVARPAPDQNVEILVADRGVGLDAEAVKHVFQPFFTQLDPSRHSSGDFGFNKRGLGLGLSIAKSFVDMHGGTIAIESRDGGGTRITVRLPRVARRERENLMPTALIVEDEPEANKLLAMLVQLRGYQTESALDGAQAMDHLRKQTPDVIFLDLMLPDVDGYDICRSLKSSGHTSQIPVIIVTARITDANRIESFRAGADDFIPKPYMPDEIFEALEHAQAWKAQLESSRIDGEASLDGRDEGETLRSLARLRNALLSRSGLGARTIEEISRAIEAIWSSARAWEHRGSSERGATLKYSLTEPCLTLTVVDEGGWLESRRQLAGARSQAWLTASCSMQLSPIRPLEVSNWSSDSLRAPDTPGRRP